MKLKEYEQVLNELIEKDINDPEVFETLRLLIYYWFLRFKKLKNKGHAHDLATEMAGDLYMKMIDGLEVMNWLSYLRTHYFKYLRDYREYNYKQYFNMEGDPEAVHSMIELFSGSFGLSNFDDVASQEVGNIDFIEYLPQVLEEMIERRARYSDSADLLNFKISILMSLIRENDEIFRLPKNEINYVKLFKNVFKVDLREELVDLSGGGALFCEKEVLDNLFSPYADEAESGVSDFE